MLRGGEGRGGPLWGPAQGDRVEKLARRFALPETVAQEVIGKSGNDLQCALLGELVSRTRLRPEIALACLSERENDMEKALALFEERKGELLPSHFCEEPQGAGKP